MTREEIGYVDAKDHSGDGCGHHEVDEFGGKRFFLAVFEGCGDSDEDIDDHGCGLEELLFWAEDEVEAWDDDE